MIEPRGGWTPLNTSDQRVEYMRAHGLASSGMHWERALTYTGYYVSEPLFCALVGFSGEHIAIIEIDGALHCISPTYLKEMQLPATAALPAEAVYVDVETTGFDFRDDRMIELAARRVRNGAVVDTFHELIYSEYIPRNITELTGITQEMVAPARGEGEVIRDFFYFLDGAPVIAHNVSFDAGMLKSSFARHGFDFESATVDSLKIARIAFPYLKRHTLEFLAGYLNIKTPQAHRALHDVDTMLAMVNAAMVAILQRQETASTAIVAPRYGRARPKAAKPTKSSAEDKPLPTPTKPAYTKFKKIDHKAIKAQTAELDESHPLFGKNIVFTGELTVSREDAMQRAVDCGAVIKTSVSKKTNYVVVGQQDGAIVSADGISGKERRARELMSQGVESLRILEEAEFLRLTGTPVPL